MTPIEQDAALRKCYRAVIIELRRRERAVHLYQVLCAKPQNEVGGVICLVAALLFCAALIWWL
jgi:hypothetical protein